LVIGVLITYIRYDSLALRAVMVYSLKGSKPCTTTLFPIPYSLFPSAKRYMERDRLIEGLKTSDRISFWWD